VILIENMEFSSGALEDADPTPMSEDISSPKEGDHEETESQQKQEEGGERGVEVAEKNGLASEEKEEVLRVDSGLETPHTSAELEENEEEVITQNVLATEGEGEGERLPSTPSCRPDDN
jgi:hypothetical protein